MNRIIHKEIIPVVDPRLKRQINHDSKSKEFAFDTTGIEIADVIHDRLIPILNQLQVGSCTGNAAIGAINTNPHVQAEYPIFQPDEDGALALYSAAEEVDGDGPYPPNDHGSSGLSIAKVLLKLGLISGYQHTFTLDGALKALSKYPLLVGSNWYEGMFNPDADGQVHVDTTQAIAGGHEWLVRKNTVETGLIGNDNSWGAEWGLAGSFTMSWIDFEKLLLAGGDVIVLFPVGTVPPPPTTYTS